MNARILELAAQAGFDVERLMAPHPGGFPREDMLALEGFAELIVSKVFDCIADEGFEVYEPVIQSVKERFGVDK